MLICQISDLHVRAPGELAYRRVDTAAFVRRCVSHILAQRPLPDVVVVTGDLVDRGQPEEYEHLAALLAPLSMAIYVIPGNHDERNALRSAFPAHRYLRTGGEFLHYAVALGPICLIGLDTVVPGEGGGLLCPDRLRWLEKQLDAHRDTPIVILMHHPPFLTGVSYMDRVGLQVAYPLEPIIRSHPMIEGILCGHLHRTIFRGFGGTIAATCPSPAHQVVLDFMPDAPSQFAMEPPGYLLHRWNEQDGMTSYGVAIGDFEGPYPFYEQGKLIDWQSTP
jgi:3',5'-cyclic-AMP phosphodiesterase